MERFAFKIDKTLKANLYKICRLCGIDNPDKVNILGNQESIVNVDEGEPELRRKIEVCIGFNISKDDKMPQTMCTLCVDKINDFFEFREMCFATNAQTRKLLGLKDETRKTSNIKPEIREDVKDVLPSHNLTRLIFGKNKRKRKHDELILKTGTKEDVEIKVEKPNSSTLPMRKKLRFSASNVTSSPITVASIAASAIPAAQKKNKPLTPMQRRALEQSKKELRSKEDTLKKELKSKEDASKKDITSKEDSLKRELKSKEDTSKKESKSKEDSLKKEVKLKEESVKKELRPKEEIKDEPFEAESVGNQTPAAVTAPNPVYLKVGKLKKSCTICDQRFSSKVQLERHMYSSHIPNVPRFVCTACNEIIKKSNDIKNHQLWHKLSKTPFICGLCGEHLLSVYAYSKHLRDHTPDTPTGLLVLDRECPQCQQTFVTNFLYNTHPCSVNTKRCAGCNRLQRNETEYLRHAALCSKVYINYSRHISAAAVAEESCVRIKNENDVEAAAAAEALARSSGTSLDMTPVVSLTRLTAPMLMNANQCVLIPRIIENEEITSASKTTKKNYKKGVSKKDLKRVDELLKSTMDTLVSIKHEPEIHMDTEAAEGGDNIDDEVMDAQEVSTTENDFHADDETEEHHLNRIIIKQECLDLVEKNEYNKNAGNLKKKTEILPLNKIPVLKLKITKEHGKLNSSLVEENAKIERKKKKKKRKDADKVKEKFVENEITAILNNTESESTTIQDRIQDENIAKLDNLVASDSILMPQPGIIRIKQECVDDDFNCPMAVSNYNEEDQMMNLVMTSIPHEMDIQISCVSSGVEFASNSSDNINPVIDTVVASEDIDVKPCVGNLERLLQISNVSGGAEISHSELHQKVISEHGNGNINKNKSAKCKKTKSVLVLPSTGKALKSTSGAKRYQEKESLLPRIVAVSSADDNALCGELDNIIVKKERLDVGYGDEVPLNQDTEYRDNRLAASSPIEVRHECYKEQQLSVCTKHLPGFNEEQAYIASIDFNNITIKREKDIEVSEVELNESIMNMSVIQNGFESMRNITKLVSNTTLQDRCSYAEDNDYYQDEEIEEEMDEEEEDDEGEYDGEDEIEEEREYRELELPPMLEEIETEVCSEKTKIDELSNKMHNIENLQEKDAQSSMKLVITNVVSEAKAPGVTPSNSKSYKETDKTEKGHCILMDAMHYDSSFVEPTQHKVLSVVSQKSKNDFNTQDMSSNVNSSLTTVCNDSNLSAVKVDSLFTESFQNDSNVMEILKKDINTTKEYQTTSPDISLPVIPHTKNEEKAITTIDFILESTRINFEIPESSKFQISTIKEHEMMSFGMSTSAIAPHTHECNSNTIVGLITGSAKSDLKISKNSEIALSAEKELKNIFSDVSTLETKYALEGSSADVNVSLIPEYVKIDFNTLDSSEKNVGIKDEFDNIPVDINPSAETSSAKISKYTSEWSSTDINVNLIPKYAKTDLNTSEGTKENKGIRKQFENIPVDINPLGETSCVEIIVGAITESTEKNLEAMPFNEQRPSEIIDQTSESEITHVTDSELEELQNQLNLQSSEQISEVVHNFVNTSLPLIHLHPYLEDISSSSSGNLNSSMLPELPTTSSSVVASYISAPILDEEADNLVNEGIDAINLLDRSNINEIAENNNNANIERELYDDSLSSNRERENEDQELNEINIINTL